MLPCKGKEKVPLAALALFYGPCIDSQLCKCNSLKQITLTFNAVRHAMLKEKRDAIMKCLKICEISILISGNFTLLFFLNNQMR